MWFVSQLESRPCNLWCFIEDHAYLLISPLMRLKPELEVIIKCNIWTPPIGQRTTDVGWTFQSLKYFCNYLFGCCGKSLNSMPSFVLCWCTMEDHSFSEEMPSKWTLFEKTKSLVPNQAVWRHVAPAPNMQIHLYLMIGPACARNNQSVVADYLMNCLTFVFWDKRPMT